MDIRVLLFALAISPPPACCSALPPAVQATSPELTGLMKDGGRG